MILTAHKLPPLTEFKLMIDLLEMQLKEKKRKFNQLNLKGEDLDVLLGKKMKYFTEWRKTVMGRLGTLVKILDFSEKDKAHDYIRNSKVLSFLDGSPLFEVSDNELIRMICENKYEGESPWARLVHKNVLGLKYSRAIREREQYQYLREKQSVPTGNIQEYVMNTLGDEIPNDEYFLVKFLMNK